MITISTINERFRKVRLSLVPKVSQESFAKEIGLSRSELKNIEYDKTEPKDFTIQQVCLKYGVDEEWLRTGKGEPFVKSSTNIIQFEKAHPDMTAIDRAIMEAYFNLTEPQKEAFFQYCLNVAAAYQAEGKKNTAAARSGDRVDVTAVSEIEENDALPPEFSGDI